MKWRLVVEIVNYRSGRRALQLLDERDNLIVTFPGVSSPPHARLIKAAPEMRDLLRELLDEEGPQPGTSAWAEKVRALLAATEKAP